LRAAEQRDRDATARSILASMNSFSRAPTVEPCLDASISLPSFFLVTVRNLDLKGVPLTPFKANSPLITDADTVLSFALPFQGLQPVSRQRGQCSEIRRRIKNVQLSQRLPLNCLESAYRLTVEQTASLGAAKGPDHDQNLC